MSAAQSTAPQNRSGEDCSTQSAAVLDGGMLNVSWTDETSSTFDPLWLRDNCPTAGDKRKAFRTFSIVDLPPDLQVSAAELGDGDTIVVTFSNGHQSIFESRWLHTHRPSARAAKPRTISFFDAATDLPSFTLPEPGSTLHCDLLDAVAEWGVALVNDVPGDAAGTEALASLIGHVRETDFGRLFDIIVEPETWEFSQTGLALDPHTDDPYRYTPSGTSILHCVVASTSGGDSLLADGFAAADMMRRDHPEQFTILSSVSVPFVRHRNDAVDQGEDVHLLAHAPVISLDRDREVQGIRFHERSMDTLDLPTEQTGDYYRALRTFALAVTDPANTVTFRLQPGQAIVYDNQRALHGRTAFTAEAGRRHLRLCTIDRDQFHSRLRRLREDHNRPGVFERLPSGNLS